MKKYILQADAKDAYTKKTLTIESVDLQDTPRTGELLILTETYTIKQVVHSPKGTTLIVYTKNQNRHPAIF